MNKKIHKTLTNGIDFLAKGQEKNGSFFCLDSFYPNNYKQAFQTPAIVPTNIVLSSLAHIANDKATKIKQKAVKFLLSEKGKYWSFNYWFKKSDWYKKEPYPDDTDDTFCALAALYEYDPKLFDGEAMARIVTMLTSVEENEGGPYDMWLVPLKARKKWHRIDLVCNSNIAYFLSLQNISLPKLTAFIEKSIDKKDYEFPYITPYPSIYFISRFYKGRKTKQMTDLLFRNQEADGKWEDPLRTALAISSLINIEGFRHAQQLKKGIAYLIKTQKRNGGWDPYSFFFHMKTKKKTLFAGSPFITTALCLEAINKYKKISNSKFLISKSRFHRGSSIKSGQIPSIKSSKIENKIYDAVLEKYKQRFSGFSKDFQGEAVALADKILKKNKDIVLLSFYFRNSIGSIGKKTSDDLMVQLGLANLFGWVAYTIYDDFLDEEGDPKKLSLANVCLRESAEIFASVLPHEIGFADFSKNIFDIIDNANMWEVARYRAKFPPTELRQFSNFTIPNYGDYSQLANKSLGYVLGPIAILFALGYKTNSPEVSGTMRFFKNYIIARQLNDDAHDWEDDLKRGQVNAVVAMLLKDAKGSMSDPKKLREIFWRKTILSACKDILKHVKFAKKDLERSSLIKEPGVFAGMLEEIECSANKAIEEREETMKFLKTYKPC